jgi:hypothetical protein
MLFDHTPSKNHVLGFHGWDETITQGSIYLVNIFFLLLIFFLVRFFSLAKFFFGKFFVITFFFGPPQTPSFFSGSPYLPQPTYLPHLANPLPHPPPFTFTSIAKASNLERAWIAQNFKSTKSTRASRARSFKNAPIRGVSTWWQQECKSKRSFNMVAKVGAWS